MNRLSGIVLFVLALPLLNGCDLFRKMAGRPTSAEIEAKRIYIEQQERGHRNRLDSLQVMQKQISDSLALLDSVRAIKSSIVEVRQLSDETRSSLKYRYYVIVGTFGNADNAEKRMKGAEQAGYSAVKIRYRNGFTAVGVLPSDSLSDAFASLRGIRDGGFCPDAWILENSAK